MAHAGAQEFVDRRRNLVRMAERAVALRGAPEVHRVAPAQDFRGIVEGAVAAVVDADEKEVRGVETFDGPVRLPRRRLDYLQPLGVALRRHDIAHPAVGLAPDAAQRRLLACTAPDWRPAGSERRRLHVHVLELHEPAAEGHRLACPQRTHHVDGFVEPCAAFPHVDAARIEFAGKFAADPCAEHEAAAGEVIDGDDLLRDRGGGAQRHQVHAGAEDETFGQRRRIAQAHEGVEDRRGVRDVLAAPQ